MKTRYLFFKKLFPDFVIVFKDKGKYNSLGLDSKLIPYLKKVNISFIVIDKRNRIRIFKKYPNEYNKYLIKVLLEEMIIKRYLNHL